MTRREFYYKNADGTSDKFWAIALQGNHYTLHFGRRGTPGQQHVKEFDTADAAATACEKAIADKLKKGYIEVQPISFLHDALERIKGCIGNQIPALAEHFQPGLSRVEIDAKLADFPYVLSEEVYQLYGWHNGTQAHQPFGLLPGYLFLPLEECVTEYQQTLQVYQNLAGVDDWESLYDPHWFPIFCEEGNYYVVPGTEAPGASSPVLDKFSEDPDIHELFDNLTQMMQAIAECWEAGIYRMEQTHDGFCYVVGDDETAANRVWLKYQSQRAVNVDIALTQQVDTLTAEQQLTAYRDLVTTQHPDALAILQQAIHTTSQTDIDQCCQILYWVGELRSPEAATVLLSLLDHPDTRVQLTVISMLVWRVGYEVLQQTPDLTIWVERLIQRLQQGGDMELGHRDIVMLLGMIGDRRACQPLLDLLNVQYSPFLELEIKFPVIKALVRLREPSIADSLYQLALGNSNPTLCLAAGRALRALGDERGMIIINQLIESNLPTISDVARRVQALEPDEFLKYG